jgi:hypothetical protein
LDLLHLSIAKLCSSLQYFSTIAELINTSEQLVDY